ncbi:MAG: XdhC/CoxI family protein [Rhodospirillaceae bacterium]
MTLPTGPAAPALDVLDAAFDWRRQGKSVALATVVQTWGSSPRPPGSHLAVTGEGEIAGSVSGGCIEGAVVKEALDILAGAPAKVLEFGVTNEQAWDVGLACGGTVRVLVRDIAPSVALYEQAVGRLASGESSALVTKLETGESDLLGADALPDAVAEGARGALRDDRSRALTGDDGDWFVEVVAPARRMIIVGAVHIAQALAPMAAMAGFDVTVVDPRRAFASDARFPDIHVMIDWPDDAMAELKPDTRTAVVTLTHDSKIDDPALDAALRSPAFYIGALGSTRTMAKRVQRLTQAGFGEDAIARIHGPVGLDISAQSPAEIAVSILGQVISVMRGTPTP